jgi:hypothetical protein
MRISPTSVRVAIDRRHTPAYPVSRQIPSLICSKKLFEYGPPVWLATKKVPGEKVLPGSTTQSPAKDHFHMGLMRAEWRDETESSVIAPQTRVAAAIEPPVLAGEIRERVLLTATDAREALRTRSGANAQTEK